ncbi:esterase [Nakamurella antarctica]|uniref:Esterase n=1 Tax=Nakamurella antarctica TaxID=1902245 RepID=A0A3G8ZMK6_9ACTN|nr:alpha/beta hydrolase-fold protein [Nakamurella antarctica]AZI58483.1 esterase [Nakamurella antarctica]
MLDLSLISGPMRVILLLLGVLGLLYLACGRTRQWWTRSLPLAMLAGAGCSAALVFFVNIVWVPFPDGLSWLAAWWLAFTFASVAAAVIRIRAGAPGIAKKVVLVAAVVAVGVSGAAQVNQHFGSIPDVRALIGADPPGHQPIEALTGSRAIVAASPDATLAQVWRPPAGMPAGGATATAEIPGSISGFAARGAWIYVPPSYLSNPRAELPVLVLTSGQPGSARDWFNGGNLLAEMNAFATAHNGLAPVVVAVDSLGGTLSNPLCLDSKRGNSFTYLSVDVPAWIRANLQVSPDPKQWTIGGFSAGGTCALQLAVNAPEVYPNFIDVAGETGPHLQTIQKTIDTLFGGDTAAFQAVNPLDVLSRHKFPHSAGVIVGGQQDTVYLPDALKVKAATEAAGMDITYLELPGDHTWRVWGPGLVDSLPWLADRMGLKE